MNKKKDSQTLFEMAMIVLAVKDMLEATSLFHRPEWVDSLLVLMFLFFICWKLALQTYTFVRLCFMGGLGALCAYTCINGNYFFMFLSYLCIIAMQDVDLAEAIKKPIIIKVCITVVHILYYAVVRVISPESITYIYRNGVKRSFFFLSHPNTFSMIILWSTIALAYIFYKNINRIHLGVFWFINLFFYLFTNSNTGIMVSTIVFGLMILEKSQIKLRGVPTVSKYIFGTFSVVIPAFVAVYPKLSGIFLEVYNKLNDFFTGRLIFGSYVYDTYGISWFGRTIFFPKKTYWRGHWFDEIVFDNAYIWMFVIYGYFYLLLMSMAFLLISKRTTIVEKILIIGYAFYGIMEAYIISASFCMPLLFIGKYMYQALDEKRQKKRMVQGKNAERKKIHGN